MKAGRKCDWAVEVALYHPTLMTDEDTGKPDPLRWHRNTGQGMNAFNLPHYSTDDAVAMNTVSELVSRGFGVQIRVQPDQEIEVWIVHPVKPNRQALAKTVAHALSLAVLAAFPPA